MPVTQSHTIGQYHLRPTSIQLRLDWSAGIARVAGRGSRQGSISGGTSTSCWSWRAVLRAFRGNAPGNGDDVAETPGRTRDVPFGLSGMACRRAPYYDTNNPSLRRRYDRSLPIFTQRISPNLRSDLLVVKEPVAPPGTWSCSATSATGCQLLCLY